LDISAVEPSWTLDELCKLDQWVCWRYSERPGKKPAKEPTDPRTGALASTKRPATWSSYELAFSAKGEHEYDGIGFVLTAGDAYSVVDLDGCIDPDTGELEPWAAEIVAQFDSYTELSPSGTGLHIWMLGTLPRSGVRSGPVEAYSAKRYVTVTGQGFSSHRIGERQSQLDDLYRTLAPAGPQPQAQAAQTIAWYVPEDAELLEKGSAAATGVDFCALYYEGDLSKYGKDHSRADMALMGMLAFWTGKNSEQMERLFTNSALGQRTKWRERADYRERTVRKAIQSCRSTYSWRPKAHPEVLQKIGRLEEMAALLPWSGRNGARNRYVLDALLHTGGGQGVLHPAGVVVRTSIRYLAVIAGIGSVDGVQGAIKELEAWVMIVQRGRDTTTTNTYLIKERAEPVQSFTQPVHKPVPELRALLRRVRENGTHQPGGDKKMLSRDGNRNVSHIAYVEDRPPVVSGSVGKRGALVLEKVLLVGGRTTLEELAQMLDHPRPRDLRRRQVARLLEAGLLLEDGEYLCTPSNLGERLTGHLETTGISNAERRQNRRYETARLQRRAASSELHK
jgi:hypothetical protein